MEEKIYKHEKTTLWTLVILCIALLGLCLYYGFVPGYVFLAVLVLLTVHVWKNSNLEIRISEEGITDQEGNFIPWKAIDHCFFDETNTHGDLVIVRKKQNQSKTDQDDPYFRRHRIMVKDYIWRKQDLKESINTFAGKDMFLYSSEDKLTDKESLRSNRAITHRFLLILIASLAIIMAFSYLFARKMS